MKISKMHHRTKTGVVKKNPSKLSKKEIKFLQEARGTEYFFNGKVYVINYPLLNKGLMESVKPSNKEWKSIYKSLIRDIMRY